MAEAQGNQNQGTGEQNKTFTQAEVDAIIGDRLAREKSKYADYEDLKAKAEEYDKQQEASKSELQKAQEKFAKLQAKIDSMEKQEKVRQIRSKAAKDSGVPEELLTGEDEEACKAQAEAILKFAKGNKYPGVKETNAKASVHQPARASDASEEDFRELAGQVFGRKG